MTNVNELTSADLEKTMSSGTLEEIKKFRKHLDKLIKEKSPSWDKEEAINFISNTMLYLDKAISSLTKIEEKYLPSLILEKTQIKTIYDRLAKERKNLGMIKNE